MYYLEVEGLCKQYTKGLYALYNVCLTVNPGESVAIIGPNGAGKSTFIKCLVRLEKPTSGKIRFNDLDITKANKKSIMEVRKNIGFIFQNFNLIPNLSVFQNVLFGNMGRKKNPTAWWPQTASQTDRERVMQHLDRVGLADFAKRRVDTLSGGQKQRVAIAKMLMQEPRMVIADEPVASLDPKSGLEIIELLHEISKEKGLTVMTVLHQLEFAIQYFDRLVAFKSGEIVMDRPTKKVQKEQLRDIYEHSLARVVT